METTPAKPQRRPPPAAGEGEPEAKRSRLPWSPDSAGGRRRVVLNPADCDLDFDVDGNGLQGHALHEEGFAYCSSGARASVGITGGKYCFGCRIMSEQKVQMEDTAPDQRHLCRLGISRADDPVGSLGESDHSFGFGGTGKFSTAGKFSDYGAKFGVGDTIICAVNLENRPLASIGYSLNGKWLGSAKQFDAGPEGLRVLDSSPSKLSWESALFPHVLLKNVVVQMHFSIEDGLIPEEGYKPWNSALEDGHAIIGPSFPAPKECEVMMMVGLPASGKTMWAEKWVKDHPEKRYVLLGTNLALEHMKVPGLLRKQNYDARFDHLMDRATKIFNTLLSRACKRPHNYIIDQTNVYKSARKRILQPFVHIRKIAVVVFPTPDELKSRADRRFKEMGKVVPAESVNEMLAQYVLPVSKDMPCADECFDEVIFPELGRSEAQRCLEEMKCVVRSASNLGGRSNVSPFNTPSSVTVLGGYYWSGGIFSPRYNSPTYSVPVGHWQGDLYSRMDNPQSPVQAIDVSCTRESHTRGSQCQDRETTPRPRGQKRRGGLPKLFSPTSPCARRTYEEEEDHTDGSQGQDSETTPRSRSQTDEEEEDHTDGSRSQTDEEDHTDGSQGQDRETTTLRPWGQRRRGGLPKLFSPTSPFKSQTDEEEEDACSTQASTSAEDGDVSLRDSAEEAPPHVDETRFSSPEEAAAPDPSGDVSHAPSAEASVLPGAGVEGHEPAPSTGCFPEHGVDWPEGPQTAPFVGAEMMLDTLISGVRALFQRETLPPAAVEAVRSALRSGTRAYHALGLPREPWMAAVESSWEEFRRALAASEWKSRRLKIQQLEDEISALSDEARELQSNAEDVRGRRSAVEAKLATDKAKIIQYQRAAQCLATVVETSAKVVQQLRAEEATLVQKDSDLQHDIATRRAQIEELTDKNPPPPLHTNLSQSSSSHDMIYWWTS